MPRNKAISFPTKDYGHWSGSETIGQAKWQVDQQVMCTAATVSFCSSRQDLYHVGMALQLIATLKNSLLITLFSKARMVCCHIYGILCCSSWSVIM